MRWFHLASGVLVCVNSLFALAAPTSFVVKFCCIVNTVDTCSEVLVELYEIDLEPLR